MPIAIEAVLGDVFERRADVLALKFAQNLFGVDLKVVSELSKRGTDLRDRLRPLVKRCLSRLRTWGPQS